MNLITGATSFVGRAVVLRLADERRRVRCLLCPSDREQRLPTGIPLSTVSARMGDLPALRTAMQDVTAVVHLAGEADLRHDGALRTHVEDTVNLITAAQDAGVRRFIYVSCLGADRASAYPLFRNIGEAEAAIRESGLKASILQAPIVYGPDDSFTDVLVMLAKAIPLVLPIPDAGLSRFQPLWVVDLATCVVATLDREEFVGQTVPLGGPEHFTFAQMVAQLLAAAGIRRRLVRIRMPLMQAAAVLFDALLPRNPTPRWWLDLLTVGSATELGTIPRNFEFEPSRFGERLDYVRRKRPWRRDLVRFVLDRH